MEYAAIAKITKQMATADKSRDGCGLGPLATALHRNRQLWTALACDVADADNPLPAELKARVLALAEFTHLHSTQVLQGQAEVDVLLDINTAIMRGLQ